MNFDDIIASVISDFMQKEDAHILYLSLDASVMHILPDRVPGEKFIADLENPSCVRLPLAPFMQILAQCKPSIDSITANTYSLQRNSFISWFEKGSASERNDILITEELYYEKKRCRETVISMLKQMCKGTYIILNAQEMKTEATDIIRKLEDETVPGKIIFCFDITRNHDSYNTENMFFKEITNRKNFFEITHYVDSSDAPASQTCRLYPGFDSFKSLSESLRSNRIFLSLGQALELSKYISDNTSLLHFSQMQFRELYFEMALVCFYSGETDSASFYLNNVLENHMNDEMETRAIFFLSQVLFAKNAFSSALKYANLVLQKTENDKTSPLYALGFMMAYIITERIGRTSSIENYQKAQELLSKAGFINNCIYTSLIMPWPYLSNPETQQQLLGYVERAADSAEKLDNQFGLSTACHWKGIVLARAGRKEESLKWYFKCDKIRTGIGEIQGIIKIRNGLSYEYLIRAEYHKAYDLINNYLDHINEIKDYTEVIVTLYNLSKTLFFSRNFSLAYTLFQKILSLMHLFGVEDFIYCTTNDLVLLKAVIDFYNGDYMQSKISLHNVTHANSFTDNGLTTTVAIGPLIEYLKALFALRESNLAESLSLFNGAEDSFYKYCSGQEHQLVFMYFEYSAMLKMFGYSEESVRFWDKGTVLAGSKELSYFSHTISYMSPEQYAQSHLTFSPLNANLDYIEDFAVKEQLLNKLHKQIRDSQFLNKIMNYGTSFSDRTEYTLNVGTALFDYTLAEAVFIGEKAGNSWSVLASITRNEKDVPSPEQWDLYMQEQPENSSDRIFFNENRNVMFSNISKFDFAGGIAIVPGDNTSMEQDDLNNISIAVTNIQAQLVMLNQNEHLMFMSSTDQLSQLKNRRALQERLSVDSETIRRYEGKKNNHFQISVTFMDLDNFKYYNDTYGHEAGDLFISSFAKLLRKIYRRIDFVSRFGGDEFVILLPHTEPSEAKRAAERVKEGLAEEKYFIPELEQLTGMTIEVEESKHIGFSAGICSNLEIENFANMEETMTNADSALYYAKEHKKGSVVLWHDIKDLLPSRAVPPVL